MGQHSSKTPGGIYFRKIPPLFSVKNHVNNDKPHEPISFQYKLTKSSKRKSCNKSKNCDNLGFSTLKNVLGGVKSECNSLKKCSNGEYKTHFPSSDISTCHFSSIKISHIIKKDSERSEDKKRKENIRVHEPPSRTNSEPNLRGQRGKGRRKQKQNDEEFWEKKADRFGYEIQNIDKFLSQATLSKPANIPVVLAFPSILYETRSTGYQTEVSLPLGMVVNAIFRNQNWLYVQTPHAEEGYIAYSACLPLGIIPPPSNDQYSPCWERSTDIFPKPFRNLSTGTVNSEITSCQSENEDDSYCPNMRYRTALSTCGEKSVDRLYLRAAAMTKGKGTRRTLLVINEDFKARGKESISVKKNEVVFLLHARIQGWFFVKNKDGKTGYIPSVIAGHGFL